MTFDWQTIVVTLIALAAAAMVARRFIPSRRKAGAPGKPAVSVACEHCETGTQAVAEAAKSRTRPTPVVSVDDLRASAKRR